MKDINEERTSYSIAESFACTCTLYIDNFEAQTISVVVRSYECNSSWCFDTGYSNTRLRTGIIYLATDVEMNLFYLKFGNRKNR